MGVVEKEVSEPRVTTAQRKTRAGGLKRELGVIYNQTFEPKGFSNPTLLPLHLLRSL